LNAIKVEIKVIPNAPRNQVQGLADGVWKIKIAAPPDKGKANQELSSFLADKLGLRRADIELVRGAASRHKVLAINGISQESLGALLSPYPSP
jgi:uncharacterized protein